MYGSGRPDADDEDLDMEALNPPRPCMVPDGNLYEHSRRGGELLKVRMQQLHQHADSTRPHQ